MKQGDYVTAYKGSVTQQFTRRSWDVMGTDKCGWAIVPDVPKEILTSANSVAGDELVGLPPAQHRGRFKKKKR